MCLLVSVHGLTVDMAVVYRVPLELRGRLKVPFGVLVRGTFSETMSALVGIVGGEKPPVVVDGEEDLLVLVAVLYAPVGGLVVYGQPGEGVVVVRVTEAKRAEALGILKGMEIVRKAK